jgi:hypothetical protein
MSSSPFLAFLTWLAVERTVSAATQTIALNALAFLYMKFFNRPLGGRWCIPAIVQAAKAA